MSGVRDEQSKRCNRRRNVLQKHLIKVTLEKKSIRGDEENVAISGRDATQKYAMRTTGPVSLR
jgi:hypothetical protein